MIAVGIDPGKNGGIVIIENKKVELHKCPVDIHMMASILRHVKATSWIDNVKAIVAIEKVWAFPTDARSAAFKFGVNYGIWKGIIKTLNLPMIEVTPRTWMKSYAPLPKEKKERKKALKDIAIDTLSNMFNNKERVTYAVSDAALIALWCLERNKEYAVDER
jgi:hypothetical protein